MNTHTFIGIVIAILFVVLAGVIFLHPHQPPVIDSFIGKSFIISELRVITGSEFSIKLEDGRLVHAFLDVKTPPEATGEVIKKLHGASKSHLEIKNKSDKGWIADVVVVECSGTSCYNISLTTWLKENKLAWE